MQSTIERLRARRERLEDREGGFTLIELLIVIVILAILAAIVVFAVSNLSTQSAQASCKSDYQTVTTAVEAYKAQEGVYPDNTTTPVSFGSHAGDTNAVAALQAGPDSSGNGPWLKTDAINGNHYQVVAMADGSGTVQVYKIIPGGTYDGTAHLAPTSAHGTLLTGANADALCSQLS
jgi:general secretion pathway protein G